MAAAGGAGAGAAAAAAAAAARRRRLKFILEVLDSMESVKCPQCGQGTLLPLFASSSTNWVCSRPDCAFMIHQHGSQNSKVWKGEAAHDQAEARGKWLESP
jgi:hypothetical protein